MFGGRSSWVRYNVSKLVRISKRHGFFPTATSSNKHNTSSSNYSTTSSNNNGGKMNDIRGLEAYRDLDKLDFMKAAKILFTHPPKNKKFGLDFHLVQLFFALMPSLAVYLVAQYARSEMRKMDAELEVKKKAEEEEKAKEKEAKAAEEKAKVSEFSEVKERLEALEVTVNEIVVDKKKQTNDEKTKNAAHGQEMKDLKSHSDNKSTSPEKRATPSEVTPGSGKQQK